MTDTETKLETSDEIADTIQQWAAIYITLVGPRATANMLRAMAKEVDEAAGALQ